MSELNIPEQALDNGIVSLNLMVRELEAALKANKSAAACATLAEAIDVEIAKQRSILEAACAVVTGEALATVGALLRCLDDIAATTAEIHVAARRQHIVNEAVALVMTALARPGRTH